MTKNSSAMFPHKITPVDGGINDSLMRDFHGEKSGFCQVGEDKFVLPIAFQKHAESYYTLPLRRDDIWVVTYPRSGTTICQELVWLVNNNLDYGTSRNVSLQDRFPFLEVNTLIHDDFAQELIELNDNPIVTDMIKSWKTPGPQILDQVASPRHVKTHLPFKLLPPALLETCKVFYVARNPKDVVVSYYHHNRHVKLHDYRNDFRSYWNYFKNDLLVFSPYWAHVKDGWERRKNPNLLFMYYEDMIKDMHSAIRKVADFLGKTMSEKEIDKLASHLYIDNFRKNVPLLTSSPLQGFVNPTEEGFIRKGRIGGNKELDEEITKEADEWIARNLEKTGITPFPIH